MSVHVTGRRWTEAAMIYETDHDSDLAQKKQSQTNS